MPSKWHKDSTNKQNQTTKLQQCSMDNRQHKKDIRLAQTNTVRVTVTGPPPDLKGTKTPLSFAVVFTPATLVLSTSIQIKYEI